MTLDSLTLRQDSRNRALVRRWYSDTPLYAGSLRGTRACLEMGLFSLRSYAAGDLVFKIEGPVVHRWNSILVEAIEYPNAVGVARNRWIDPLASNPLRFINHSCTANIGYFETGHVVALQRIRKGVELTLDYSISESDLLWEFAPQTAGGVRMWQLEMQGSDPFHPISSVLCFPFVSASHSDRLSVDVSSTPYSKTDLCGEHWRSTGSRACLTGAKGDGAKH